MSDEIVFAIFEPTEPKMLSTVPQAQLLVDNPLLASALSSIFPYLLFIDNFLEVITWTNDDPFLNLLLVVVYSVLVLYWRILKYCIVPILSALIFSSIVWNTSSIIHDARYGEKPTIEEVFLALHNITARFELLLRPAQHLDLSSRNYMKMITGTVILTPLHFLLVKYVFSPQTVLWLIGVILLTYHSPFSFATRRLLWRSVYLRISFYYLTGLNIHLTRNDYLVSTTSSQDTKSKTHSPSPADLNDQSRDNSILDNVQAINNFTVLQKVIVSSSQLKQIIQFEIMENERRWIGLGWSKYLLPNERASFCYEPLMLSAPDPNAKAEFDFPTYENDLYTYQWQWIENQWSLDLEFNRSRHKNGWVYYDKNWDDAKYEDGFSRYTRTRRWTRRALLLIDKRGEVYDESS